MTSDDPLIHQSDINITKAGIWVFSNVLIWEFVLVIITDVWILPELNFINRILWIGRGEYYIPQCLILRPLRGILQCLPIDISPLIRELSLNPTLGGNLKFPLMEESEFVRWRFS